MAQKEAHGAGSAKTNCLSSVLSSQCLVLPPVQCSQTSNIAEVCRVVGTRESQAGVTSAEIAKALGHPSAAGTLLSTLSEHPSSVSTSGTSYAEASSSPGD